MGNFKPQRAPQAPRGNGPHFRPQHAPGNASMPAQNDIRQEHGGNNTVAPKIGREPRRGAPRGGTGNGGSRAPRRGGPGRRPPEAFAKPGVINSADYISPTRTDDVVRVMVLGGLEEVGRNCTLIEYKNDIILIDMGLQFPDEDMPGVDYIIPNMSYIKGKEKNVRGVVITHGHYDHIGAIPHIVPHIGNPTVYALPVAAGIIKRRQVDFPGTQVNVQTIQISSTLQLGVFKVHFFHINHNIPDSAGIVIETPNGIICHTGDWKYDFHPVGAPPADFWKMSNLGQQGVTLLMGDSTNADRCGHQKSEKDIGEELQNILEKAKGRIIVGTFASLLSRVKQIMEISERLGRKIAIDGFSMKTNVEIAKELGYIKVQAKNIIPIDQVNSYPPDKVTIICTGAQGEKNAALSRIANDEHRFVRVERGDTVIFSSSVVPGNEASVQRLKDTFYRKRARVIHKDIMDVHAGGHALKEDIKLMLSLFKPTYYMPIEGNHFLLRENAEVAYSMGWSEQNVFVADNGQIVELRKKSPTGFDAQLTKEKVPSDHVFVDGLGVGDISQVVLRDRQALAEDGMVIVIAQFEQHTGKLITTPDIISKGFMMITENKEFVLSAKEHLKKIFAESHTQTPFDSDTARSKIREELGQFLFQKTERRPMILPIILEM